MTGGGTVDVGQATLDVLDRVEQLANRDDRPERLLREAQMCVASALRYGERPDGGGRKRVIEARWAAALLLLALSRMDDDGREVTP